MRGEREVAGLRCGQVLEQLSEYLEGELAPEVRGRIEAHVRACDHCARFGGVFSAAVGALRVVLRGSGEQADAHARLDDLLGRLAR